MSDPDLINKIDHIVVIMLENRSFDHMLGYLYEDQGNKNQYGEPFEGLTGNESNLDNAGVEHKVFKIPVDQHPYYWPGSDPGEGYNNTNSQLFGCYTTPPAGTEATNQGFVKDYAYTLNWQKTSKGYPIVEGTVPGNIMGMYHPELLPVLSGLAKGYAVCDHWFCSVPTETLPNRAFMHMATSLGRLNDDDQDYNAPSIFNLIENKARLLADAGTPDPKVSWAIYGYEGDPILTRQSLVQLPNPPVYGSIGGYGDFEKAVADGTLAGYTFLTPEFGSKGNSQHPNHDVARGEQYLYEIYQTLRNSSLWEKTLLVITYDEHGGTYDHVPPPENAKQPKDCPDNKGFNFQRFGVRVPTVLVSPWIKEQTIFRIPEPDTDLNGSDPDAPTAFDHTSILRTVEQRFGLGHLTDRDLNAPPIGGVLNAKALRTDDPLANVTPPVSQANPTYIKKHLKGDDGSYEYADHLHQVEAKMVNRLPVDGDYHSKYDTDYRDWDEDKLKQYTQDRYHKYYKDGHKCDCYNKADKDSG